MRVATLETGAQEHPLPAPLLTESQRARESRPGRPAEPGFRSPPARQSQSRERRAPPRTPQSGPLRPRPSKQTGPHPLDTGLPSSPIGTVSKGQIDDPG